MSLGLAIMNDFTIDELMRLHNALAYKILAQQERDDIQLQLKIAAILRERKERIHHYLEAVSPKDKEE